MHSWSLVLGIQELAVNNLYIKMTTANAMVHLFHDFHDFFCMQASMKNMVMAQWI
jgi:hypothetical protein